jgi:hypothetical protein
MFQILSVIGLWLIGKAIGRFLFIFGIGFLFYSGFDSLLDNVITQVVSSFGGIATNVALILSMFGLDEAISIGLSGASIIASVKGAVAAKKLIFT